MTVKSESKVLEYSIIEVLNFENLRKENSLPPSSVYCSIVFVKVIEIFCLL